MRKSNWLGFVVAVVSLVGCGDGGGSTPTGPPPPLPHCTLADSYGSGLAGSTVIAADLDGDGNTDLIAVGMHGFFMEEFQVLVRRGKGDGTFGEVQSVPTGGLPGWLGHWGAAVADFDRDGHVDLAVWSQTSTSVVEEPHASLLMLRGKGDGTFAAPVATAMGSPRFENLFTADFDRDGIPDLVLSSGAILRGKGDGSFADPVDLGIVSDLGIASELISVRDIDGNGTADLSFRFCAIDAPCTGVTVAPGHGDGTFGSPTTFEPAGSSPTSAWWFGLLADVDGDGHPDAVGWPGSGTLQIQVLHGHGDGTFALSPVTTPSLQSSPLVMFAADVNGDGADDLLYPTSDGGVVIHHAAGDGTFGPAATFASPASGSDSSVVVGDFNRDGHLDIAAGAVLLGNGDGTFRSWRLYPAEGSLGAVGDFDGDGHLDAVSGHDVVMAMRGVGDGTLQSLGFLEPRHEPSNRVVQVGIGALAPDRRAVVAVQAFPPSILAFPSTGPGTFGAAVTTPFAAASTIWAGAVADADGDGIVDAVVFEADSDIENGQMENGTATIFYGDRSGGFSRGIVLECTAWVAGATVIPAVHVVDVDGDHVPDVIACDRVFRRTAPRAYAAGSPIPPLSVVGFLDGDDLPDLVAVRGTTLLEFHGVGGGEFGQVTLVDAPQPIIPQLIADLDNDGLGDVVAAGSVGATYVFPGGGGPPIVRAGSGSSMLAADLDGDGGLDLIASGISVLRSTCSR